MADESESLNVGDNGIEDVKTFENAESLQDKFGFQQHSNGNGHGEEMGPEPEPEAERKDTGADAGSQEPEAEPDEALVDENKELNWGKAFGSIIKTSPATVEVATKIAGNLAGKDMSDVSMSIEQKKVVAGAVETMVNLEMERLKKANAPLWFMCFAIGGVMADMILGAPTKEQKNRWEREREELEEQIRNLKNQKSEEYGSMEFANTGGGRPSEEEKEQWENRFNLLRTRMIEEIDPETQSKKLVRKFTDDQIIERLGDVFNRKENIIKKHLSKYFT